MHYLLAIGLILPLTQAYPGTVLPTQPERATAPEVETPQIYSANDETEEDEEDDEPDCD